MSRRHVFIVVSLVVLICVQAADSGATAPTDAEADTVVVTATRLDGDPFLQPYAIIHTDRKHLDEANARTLTDAISLSPGVYSQRTAQSQASPYIRGLTGEQTLILFDGVRFNHAMMRSGPNQYAATLPDEQIGAVDTILGSTSTVTGSDGLTGAIDFRLAPAGRGVDRPISAWARTRPASAEGGSVAGGVDGAERNWRWSVDGSCGFYGSLRGGRNAGDHIFGSAAGNRDIPNTGYRQDAVGARVAYDGWKGQSLELAGGRSALHDAPRPDGYWQNSGMAARLSRYYDPQTFTYLHARHRSADLGPFDATQLTGWMHRHAEHQVREDIEGAGAAARYRRREYDDTITTYGWDLQLTNRIAKVHEWTWGGTASIDRTENSFARLRSPLGNLSTGAAVLDQIAATNPGATTVPDGSRHTSAGVFVQDDWTIAQVWDLVGGLRWSRSDWAGDVTADRAGYAAIGNDTVKGHAQTVTASLRLGWRAAPVAMLFAGVGQGFRAPTLSDLMGIQDRASSSSGGQGPQVTGNPELEPERSLTYEIGAKYRDGINSASLSLFVTRLKDLIQVVYTDVDGDGQITGADSTRSVNANDGQLYGFELGHDLGLPVPLPVGWRLAFIQAGSYVHGTAHVPQADLSTRVEYLSRSNLCFGRVGLRLAMGPSWYAVGQTRWSAAYDRVAPGDATDTRHTTFGDPDGSMPGYAVIDLMGGWQSADGRFTIDGGLQNVGDVSYRPVGSGNDGSGVNAVLVAGARF